MASPEAAKEHRLSPQGIVDRLSSMGSNANVRTISAHVKDSLSGLEKKGETTMEDKMQIAIAAKNALNILTGLGKELDPPIALYRYGYPKMDILTGLGEVEGTPAQLVIAGCLDDPQEQVRKVAQDLLKRSDIKIFPETLSFLLEAKDPKDATKSDPDKTELALSIIEHNNSAGIWFGTVDQTVGKTLKDVMFGDKIIHGGNHRTAVIAGKLHERTSQQGIKGDILFSLAETVLESEIREEVESLKSKEKFDEFVNAICQYNLPSAKIVKDIYKMTLALPEKPNVTEAIKVLSEMLGVPKASFNNQDSYLEIIALASRVARIKMKRAIEDEQDKVKEISDQKRNSEMVMAAQKKLEQEDLLEKQQLTTDSRVIAEATLAQMAIDKRLVDSVTLADIGLVS